MTRCVIPVFALLAAGPGCINEPSADSVGCVQDSECGACRACRNGACVDAPEQPLCVGEEVDPCDGADNDQNGIIDDPQACWAPAWAFADPAGGTCFSSSKLAPPATCAGATRVAAVPAFALASRPIAGTVALRQCSRAGDHVLVPELPLFTEPGEPADALVPDAWAAAGWDCGVLLGWVFTAEPALRGAVTPFGPARALARWVEPESGRHGVAIGAAPPPEGGFCDPRATLWGVGDGPTTEAGPASACILPRCAPRPRASLIAQSPADGAVIEANQRLTVTWTVRNDGRRDWPRMIWTKIAGTGGTTYGRDGIVPGIVAPGDTTVLAQALAPAAPAVDLAETWELSDAVAPVLRVTFHYSTTPRALSVLQLEPSTPQRVTPGARGRFVVTLRNTSSEPLAGLQLAASVEGLELDPLPPVPNLDPTAAVALELGFTAPRALGRYIVEVRIVDADGHDVALLGAARRRRTLPLAVDVVDAAALARVVACTLPDGAVIRAGTPFYQVCAVDNAGSTTWAAGWYAERVGSEAGGPRRVTLAHALGPGERALLVLPTVARADGPDEAQMRVGWTLHDAGGAVLGATWPDGAGGAGYGARGGAWLWTEVAVGEPCMRDGQAP